MGELSRRKRDALSPPFCEIPTCDYTKFFQRHRIVPGRDGGKYKLGNVISLCPNHHKEADEALISVEELLEIVRQRIEIDQTKSDKSDPTGASGVEEGGSSPAEEPGPSTTIGTGDEEDGLHAERFGS